MKKKSDVKKEVEAEVEAAKVPAEQKIEDVVSVEMTPAQREEFVKWMARKEVEDADLNEQEKVADKEVKRFMITLIARHNVNGKKYGPGPVVVPEELLGHLQHAENQVRQAEIALHTSNKRMFQILQNGQAIPVPFNDK